jgi:hypothetical protein
MEFTNHAKSNLIEKSIKQYVIKIVEAHDQIKATIQMIYEMIVPFLTLSNQFSIFCLTHSN